VLDAKFSREPVRCTGFQNFRSQRGGGGEEEEEEKEEEEIHRLLRLLQKTILDNSFAQPITQCYFDTTIGENQFFVVNSLVSPLRDTIRRQI
jgi:hypothetical protein